MALHGKWLCMHFTAQVTVSAHELRRTICLSAPEAQASCSRIRVRRRLQYD